MICFHSFWQLIQACIVYRVIRLFGGCCCCCEVPWSIGWWLRQIFIHRYGARLITRMTIKYIFALLEITSHFGFALTHIRTTHTWLHCSLIDNDLFELLWIECWWWYWDAIRRFGFAFVSSRCWSRARRWNLQKEEQEIHSWATLKQTPTTFDGTVLWRDFSMSCRKIVC